MDIFGRVGQKSLDCVEILGTEDLAVASSGSTRELTESDNHCDRLLANGRVGCIFRSSNFLSHSSQLQTCLVLTA